MCGIHGNTIGSAIGKEALAHRGPDHYGVYRDHDVLLEHWRLSIIDLSANGEQPMAIGVEDACVIAYNGEVYNFMELKEGMKGAEFVSSSDTEVVLRLYKERGLEFIRELNGMFAFAIYDKAKKQIVLARDRFGIKPLYYHIDGASNIYFASELKALVLNHSIDVTIDVVAIQSLFHLLYIEGDRTPFNEIRKLPAGSCLVYSLETRTYRLEKFHDFEFCRSDLAESQWIDQIDSVLADSVRMHLVSDVPVGALLSGGVDSSLMVALMSRYTNDVRTFSVGYGDNKVFDESKYSDLVSKQYRTTHHHAILREQEMGTLIDDVCGVLDEPIGDTSVFLNYFVFGFVAKSVKVCLSGLGGDELFGGYNRYLACKMLPTYLGMPKVFRAALEAVISIVPSTRDTRIGNKIRQVKTFLRNADGDLGRSYCNFIDYFAGSAQPPVIAPDRFNNARFETYWDDALVAEINRIYKYDIENYMVNDLLLLTDRMSMRHSLEARVPYLENKLAELALSIPPERKISGLSLKHLLKRVAQRHLPDELIFRRKQGFSSPVAGLLTGQALDALDEELVSNTANYASILNKELFRRMIELYREGIEDYSLQIFTLFVYLRWMGQCFQELDSRRGCSARRVSGQHKLDSLA
jgi:asparagine synthase (glutamine-hydrolysing)